VYRRRSSCKELTLWSNGSYGLICLCRTEKSGLAIIFNLFVVWPIAPVSKTPIPQDIVKISVLIDAENHSPERIGQPSASFDQISTIEEGRTRDSVLEWYFLQNFLYYLSGWRSKLRVAFREWVLWVRCFIAPRTTSIITLARLRQRRSLGSIVMSKNTSEGWDTGALRLRISNSFDIWERCIRQFRQILPGSSNTHDWNEPRRVYLQLEFRERFVLRLELGWRNSNLPTRGGGFAIFRQA
jgi:hypothetical protein